MTNQLYYGDNLEVLRKYIPPESIDLCYIDPPFNSKRNYNQIYNNIGTEDKAQAQAFTDTWTWDDNAIAGYNEITEGVNPLYTLQCVELVKGLKMVLGGNALMAYIVSMTERIAEIYRVLKPTGSFYLHCDPTASHYLKLVLDSLFCPKGGNYINEITWKRSTAKGNAKQGAKHFGRITDIILFYVKNDKKYNWFPQYIPYSNEVIKKKFSHTEENSQRKYTLVPLDGPGGAAKGNPYYEFLGVQGYWRFSKARMEQMYADGKIVLSKTGKSLRQKMYLDESKGKEIDNFWGDIPKISPTSKERLGYPTQKPEALLERIIKASSNEGDTVLDAYCGCGTTVAVAQRLNRKWIGIDITYQSVSVVIKRLTDTFGNTIMDNVALSGIPKDVEAARALALKKDDRLRKEFEKWAVLTYSNNKAMINETKGADGGIDGIAQMLTGISAGVNKQARVLFSVKSGKITIDMLRAFCGVVNRENAAIGIFITLEEPTKPTLKEAKEQGIYTNPLTQQAYPKVEIVTINEILQGKRLQLPQAIEVLKTATKQKDKGKELGF